METNAIFSFFILVMAYVQYKIISYPPLSFSANLFNDTESNFPISDMC